MESPRRLFNSGGRRALSWLASGAAVIALSVALGNAAHAAGGTAKPPAGGHNGGGAAPPPVGVCPTGGPATSACIVPPAGPVLPNFSVAVPPAGVLPAILSANGSNAFSVTGVVQSV